MRGRIGLRWGALNAQRRAITDVLSIASGRSAKSARISAAGFIQASGEELTRSSRAIWLDWAMHSMASCASWKCASA